ncbi:MAG: hypothetical protein JO335_10505 [Sphingomonas sp.]|nr:hypothetical protein [Sphingomonas sp.]
MGENGQARRWWEERWFLVLVVLATMIPLLYPPIPPLVDLPGHLGHYRVELDVDHDPLLQRYYGFSWAPIGNLGVDLLILPLAKLFGLELAVKLIVLAIPPMTAAGFLWVAREIHGPVPPTAIFALPFIYGFPFLFGFLNFTLSLALAFLAFGLWLHLARREKLRLRSALFAAIAIPVFFAHIYGWSLLILLCFSAEAVRINGRGRSWIRAAIAAALQVSVMALPLVAMLITPIHSAGGVGSGWFDWDAKWVGLMGVLRDRWGPFDVTSLEIAGLVILFAIVSPKLTFSRNLALAAILLAACFILLPRYIFDSAYADVRLLPYLFAVALIAIGFREPRDRRLGNAFALLGLAFFAVRLAGTTVSLATASNQQQTKLQALNVVPKGARVASFYGLAYAEPWALYRDIHLGGLVIARRSGFSNDQWITAGHNLLELKYRDAGAFAASPSEVVRPNGTHDGVYRTIDEALAQVPRDKFDYVWLINGPPYDHRFVRDLRLVWRGVGSELYRTAT